MANHGQKVGGQKKSGFWSKIHTVVGHATTGLIPRHVILFVLRLGHFVDAGQLGEPVHLDLLDVLLSHGQSLKWSLVTSWVRPLLWT